MSLSRTSVPGNLFYKIQFLTNIEEVRYVQLPTPSLFNFVARGGWCFSRSEFEEHLALENFQAPADEPAIQEDDFQANPSYDSEGWFPTYKEGSSSQQPGRMSFAGFPF